MGLSQQGSHYPEGENEPPADSVALKAVTVQAQRRPALGEIHANTRKGGIRPPKRDHLGAVSQHMTTDSSSVTEISGRLPETQPAHINDDVDHRSSKPRQNSRDAPAKRQRLNYTRIPLQLHTPHDDLDSEDALDPMMVAEYSDEIFDFLYKLQPRFIPNPAYMDNQPELNWKVRGILINWLVCVHSKFRLLGETFLLAINIFDRYLERVQTPLSELQLLGATALFIAAKYEEVYSPGVQNYSFVSNSSEVDILRMERMVLSALDYNVSYPGPLEFLRRISKADHYNTRSRTFAKYYLEVSLVEPQLMSYRPSDIAAASMCLAREILEEPEPWGNNLIFYSGGCTREALEPIMDIMKAYLGGPVLHEDLFRKYASKKYMKASLHSRQWVQSRMPEEMRDEPGAQYEQAH